MSPREIKLETWVGWMAGGLMAGITVTALVITYAFGNFETKDHAREQQATTQNQFQDINNKLEMLLGWRPKIRSTPKQTRE